ncbi:proline dehydrogenase family protein [Desulfovibrio inopinatus]|uniref:proline dehydrogenase family protein n=1 Tax=Desulfovibrio inopinatus TaxID=102109 RepID=UPI00041BEA6C|nr:proline dehydrogenase family protein [Desulfovibrio inopinatus]
MRLWQNAMIGLARNTSVTMFMHSSRFMCRFANQFVAGHDAKAALERSRELFSRGIRSSLFFLGEYVEDETRIEETVSSLMELVPALSTAGLDVHVSVDPTQIGAMLSWNRCYDNALRLAQTIADHAGPGVNILMIDMEDASVTQSTLDLYHALFSAGLPVAITLQAYLHRSPSDIAQLVEQGAMVRLVKGAFAESADLAVSGRTARDAAYRASLDMLFSETARQHGVRPVVGSHDHTMIDYACSLAEQQGWRPDEWEVEMLLGVRPDYQRHLVERGVQVRVYMPYGSSWWPYSIRRIGETPRNLGFVARALLG